MILLSSDESMTSPALIARRYLLAATPYIVLPEDASSTEISMLPAKIGRLLWQENDFVYVQDDAGFIDPKKLARGIVLDVRGRFLALSHEADQNLDEIEAKVFAEAAKNIERHLDVDVKPVVSPKTGKKGWKVSTSPKVADVGTEVEARIMRDKVEKRREKYWGEKLFRQRGLLR